MPAMKISKTGLDLIKYFEGLKLKSYPCQAGVPTIGYGTTRINGVPVKLGMTCTEAQAEAWLASDVAQFEKDVNSLVTHELTQSQFDALVSFAYNVGSDIDADTVAEGLGDSTLLRLVNRKEYILASAEFLKWNKANGKVSKGLVKRRRAEHLLFLGGDWRAGLK